MAKRKRLSPAQTDYLAASTPTLETKSTPLGRAPIAQVASEAASAAALEELAGALQQARDEGRMIQQIDEARIDADYLVRDRMVADDEELQSLMASLSARGQQTPIEAVELEDGRYGLISGWRRLTALRRLRAETGEDRFGQVLAILRRPETAADAYVAMVEENEIRVGLSYYERARVAAKAVEKGVYDTEKQALLHLFASASRTRRSKIRSLLAIYRAVDDLLRFPAAIGERLGLSLSKVLETDTEGRDRLRALLARTGRETPEEEISVLEAALTEAATTASLARETETQPEAAAETVASAEAGRDEVSDGITVKWRGQTVTISGAGVSEGFRERLLDWIRQNG